MNQLGLMRRCLLGQCWLGFREQCRPVTLSFSFSECYISLAEVWLSCRLFRASSASCAVSGVFHRFGPTLVQKQFERLVFKREAHVRAMCLNFTLSSVGGSGFPLPNFGDSFQRSYELNACLRSLCAFLGSSAAAPSSAPYFEGGASVKEGRAPCADLDRPKLRPYAKL